MAINLSIKNVPEDVVRNLRKRASRNHRSMQGELLSILDEATRDNDRLGPRELLDRVRESGLATTEDAADMIRKDRDART